MKDEKWNDTYPILHPLPFILPTNTYPHPILDPHPLRADSSRP
jgi:hypothetical protein